MKIAHVVGKSSIDKNKLTRLVKCQQESGYRSDIYPKFMSLFKHLGLKLMAKSPDVVHVHGCSPSWYFYKKIFGKFDKTEIVQSFYYSKEEEKIKTGRAISKKLVLPDIYRNEELKSYKDKVDVSVVGEGYDFDDKQEIKAKQLSIGRNILGYGEISSDSNLHTLVETIRYLPKDYFLKWIGPVKSEGYLSDVLELAKNLNVENRVEIIICDEGGLDYDTVFYEMTLYLDLNKYTSYDTVIESMVRGVPALVLKEGTKYNISGLYYVRSVAPKSIANDIKNGSTTINNISIEEIKNAFSWEAKSDELISVYQESITFDQKKTG